jgi:hypothetical protein
MAAFHADQRGDLAGLPRLFDVGAAGRQHEVIGVLRDEALDHVDLLHGGLHGLRLGQAGRDIDRPELRADMALLHAGEVGLHAGRGARREEGGHAAVRQRFVDGVVEVETGQHILAAVAELFGHVIVAVPDGGFLQRGGDGLLGGERRSGEDGGGQRGGADREQAGKVT